MSVFARFFWVVEIKSIKKFFEKRKGKKKKRIMVLSLLGGMERNDLCFAEEGVVLINQYLILWAAF